MLPKFELHFWKVVLTRKRTCPSKQPGASFNMRSWQESKSLLLAERKSFCAQPQDYDQTVSSLSKAFHKAHELLTYAASSIPFPYSLKKIMEFLQPSFMFGRVFTMAICLARKCLRTQKLLRSTSTSSPKYFDRLRKLGANLCFDYNDPEVKKIRKATGPI
jgi:hypothetical protein